MAHPVIDSKTQAVIVTIASHPGTADNQYQADAFIAQAHAGAYPNLVTSRLIRNS